MKRLKSIDIFRGCSMTWMIFGHLFEWALKVEDLWLRYLMGSIFDPMGASAFLFIAGVSTMLSYRNRLIRAEKSEIYNKKMVCYEYFLRATFILIIALIYNTFVAIRINNLTWIWAWFILFTIAISLYIAWPLLKTPKIFRILVSGVIWISNQIVLFFLIPYQGKPNFLGILFHLFYNSINLDPILLMFPFFLIGTVVGDIIHEIFSLDNSQDKKLAVKNKVLIPSFISGLMLIIFGIFYRFPEFFTPRTFSWVLYSLGIELIFFSVLLFFEMFDLKTKKSYKFLFYYSYYSFTTYLIHNLFYFCFLGLLNIFSIWIYVTVIFILYGLLLRFIFKKWSYYFSLKAQIARLAAAITKRIVHLE